MTSLKAELDEAVIQLDERYDELKSAARRRLGSLYNAGIIRRRSAAGSMSRMIFRAWSRPSICGSSVRSSISRKPSRVAARFDEAVQLAEQAFTEEFSKLVSHLTERLSGNEDGKPKIFRDSVVENLRRVLWSLRHLNIRSNS